MKYQLQKYTKESVNYELVREFVTESAIDIIRFMTSTCDEYGINDNSRWQAIEEINLWDKESPIGIYVAKDLYIIQIFTDTLPIQGYATITDIEHLVQDSIRYFFKNGVSVSIRRTSQNIKIDVVKNSNIVMTTYDTDLPAYGDEDCYLDLLFCMTKAQSVAKMVIG